MTADQRDQLWDLVLQKQQLKGAISDLYTELDVHSRKMRDLQQQHSDVWDAITAIITDTEETA